jgi:signal peptidase I
LGNELLDAVIYAGVFVFMVIRPFAVQAFLIPSGSMWPTLYVNDFIVANKAVYRYSDPKINDIVVFRPPVEACLDHPEQVDPVTHEVKVDFIKRCKGLPGDVVELRDGVYYLNGKPGPDPSRHYSGTIDQQTFTEFSDSERASYPMANFKFIKWKGKIIPLNYTSRDANDPVCLHTRDFGYQVHPNYFIEKSDEQKLAMSLPAEKLPPGCYFMMGDNRNNSFDGRAWSYVKREAIIGRSEFIWFPLPRAQRTK